MLSPRVPASLAGQLRSLLPLVPLAPLVVQLKATQLDLANAPEVYASLNRQGPGGAAALPTMVFLADAWFLGLLLPLAILLAVWRVVPTKRPWFVAGISTILGLFLYIELKVLWEVGTFLPVSFLIRGALYADGMQFAADYVSLGSSGKLLGMVSCIWALAWGSVRLTSGRPSGLIDISALAVSLLGVGAGCLALVARPTGVNPIDMGVAAPALLSFVGMGKQAGAAPVALSTNDSLARVLSEYRAVSQAPVPNKPSSRFGRARGFNVLVVVLETAPEDCIGLLAHDGRFPAVDRVTERAIVGSRHYSTFPWTLRALYSIYTGWYPSSSPTELVPRVLANDGRLAPVPGFVRSAREAGYFTKVFMPRGSDDWNGPYAPEPAVGFESHVEHPEAEVEGAHLPERMEWRRSADREALATLLGDIASQAHTGRPFLFAFQPQYTHAPWPGIEAARTARDACQVGHGAYKEIDFQLGEVSRALSRAGIADHTIIVLVGDHGFRTRREFPWLSGAVMEELNFRVPLAIAVPGLLDQREEIPWPTSHIDVGPSILDLLGISEGRAAEAGSPVWNPALKDRRIFVWGEGFVGANGYLDSAGAYMVKYQYNGAGENRQTRTLSFDVGRLLSPTPLRDSVVGVIHQMAGLRDRLAVQGRRVLARGTNRPMAH